MTVLQYDAYIDEFETALLAGKADTHSLESFLPPEGEPGRTELLVELLRVALEHNWQAGTVDAISEYQAIYPAIFSSPEFLEKLAFEEYRLRATEGQAVAPGEYAARLQIDVSGWPTWPCRDSAALSWAEFSQSSPMSAAQMAAARRRIPKVGEKFAEFDLVALLGQGAFGKVFLARQSLLSNRLVALKITSQTAGEAQRLARLQHSHIVPVYSLHQELGLSAICMPFLGGVTLADLLAAVRHSPARPASSDAFISTIAGRQSELSTVVRPLSPISSSIPGDSPKAFEPTNLDSSDRCEGSVSSGLKGQTLEQAIVWIGVQIAAGVAHAHERGIIHRDLKPANILIADDGQPLVLDFNLSHDANSTGAHCARIGGTLPYMAPEQLEAFLGGKAIDARADVFSLGVILYEALGGKQPFPLREGLLEPSIVQMIDDRRTGPPESLRRLNPRVSPGLESIVAKCLLPSPENRYATALELSEDLRNHFNDLPLLHAPNISLAERVQKWRRRHPRLTSAASATALCFVLALIFGGVWWGRERMHARRQASRSFQEWELRSQEARFPLWISRPGSALHEEGVREARHLLEQYNVLKDPQWSRSARVALLPEEDARRLFRITEELLGHIDTDTNLLPISATEKTDKVTRAISPTEQSPGPSHLVRNRQLNSESPENPGEMPGPLRQALKEMQGGRCGIAAKQLEAMIRANSRDDSAWVLLGHCQFQLGDYSSAESSYTACVALRGTSPYGWFGRGLANLEIGRAEVARDDFSTALALRPKFAAALFNRALARQRLGEHAEAVADFSQALESGLAETRIFFARERSRRLLGDEIGADADRSEGLSRIPTDALSWIERGLAQVEEAPERALSDFQEAVRLEPQLYSGWMNLSHVLAERLKQTKNGIESLERALELRPGDTVALGSRAVLFARSGQEKEALADLANLLGRNPPPFGVYQAACVYSLLADQDENRIDRAGELFARARLLDPGLRTLAQQDMDLAALRKSSRWGPLFGPQQKADSGIGADKERRE